MRMVDGLPPPGSDLKQVEKSLRQKYSYSHSSYDSCLSCHIFIQWFQNNSTNFDTREYFELYLTKIYPKESYFVIIERSDGPF